MALFQKSVLKKYIGDINKELLHTAWQQFQFNFHNTTKQQNIRNAKEEQYQEGFLRELFTDVLGYTLNPQPNFNLTTEYKNEKDSKKADGAILNGEQVVAVIELKGIDTTDLAKVESQAFSYKNNQKGCTYVITSNFEKLRLYINDATDFEEFNLFTLSQERFTLLYLCLQKDNLLAHVPLHIKQASIAAEENVTRKLYADYSTFKKKLYHNIVALNPQYDKLVLFKKTQKLLDRFLFIFFAEDRLLLPPNSVREILKQWQQLTELDNYVPLYDRFKKYFGYLNTGHKGKLYEIFAYNGGLFATDEVLETIVIDDDTLYQSCVTISNYDFDTEVDVNILGHIFEHSLNEIEELQAELDGTAIDKTKTKRKKDGVFYTPRYITKYIVENTVGSLCNTKKAELKIVDDEFTTEKRKANKKKLLTQIDAYRQWLLQLTICDPACGSGAFLNQALDFLLAEHRYVDELKAKLFGDSIVYSDVEKEILENNLFGVDINEEAVEIARLSLWLRTAHKGRKLNNLSDNIKCGNSLIDDSTVAGDKAFNWQKEFPQVFGEYVELTTNAKPITTTTQTIEQVASKIEATELRTENTIENNYTEKITNRDDSVVNTDFNIVNEPAVEYGIKNEIKKGFDVIIGNPPYVLCQPSNTKFELLEYYKLFKVASYKIDLFHLFFEKSISLLNKNGRLSFITPNTYFTNKYIKTLRTFLLENSVIQTVIQCQQGVFYDASVDVAIIVLSKQIQNENFVTTATMTVEGNISDTTIIDINSWKNDTEQLFNLTNKKLNKFENCVKLGEIMNSYFGIQAFDRKSSISKNKINEKYLPIIDGEDINPFAVSNSTKFFNFIPENIKSGGDWNVYLRERIVIRQIGKTPVVGFCKPNILASNTLYSIYPKNELYNLKYILCILNSSVFKFFWNENFSDNKDLFPKIKGYQLQSIPIIEANSSQQLPFVEKANIMLAKNEELQKVQSSFLKLLQSKFENLQLNKKLNDWHSLTFGAFMKELEKQKIKLSLQEQADWMPFFEAEKEKAASILATIHTTNKAIDAMVYALYNLTEEEIKIVEGV